MSLREGALKKAEQDLIPDNLKSDQKQATDNTESTLDNIASYLPGQSKPRDGVNPDAGIQDPGRQGPGAIKNACTPWSQESTTEKVDQKMDQFGSKVEPNKSYTQELRDFMTPGNDTLGQGQGVTDRISGVVQGAKEGVVNMFSGEGTKKE